MEQQSINANVLKKLELIKLELDYIKSHMIDIDIILSPEESKRLDESLEEFNNGETTTLEEFEKEIKNVQSRDK